MAAVPLPPAGLGIFVTDSSTVYVVTSTIRKHNRRHIVKKCHFVRDATTTQDTKQGIRAPPKLSLTGMAKGLLAIANGPTPHSRARVFIFSW